MSKVKLDMAYATIRTMESQLAALREENRLLNHDIASFLETTAKVCELLGIDTDDAKHAEGKPSDVLFRYANDLREELAVSRSDVSTWRIHYDRIRGERDDLQQSITKEQQRLPDAERRNAELLEDMAVTEGMLQKANNGLIEWCVLMTRTEQRLDTTTALLRKIQSEGLLCYAPEISLELDAAINKPEEAKS